MNTANTEAPEFLDGTGASAIQTRYTGGTITLMIDGLTSPIPGGNQNSSGDRAQNTSVLPYLWVPDNIQGIDHLTQHFCILHPGDAPKPGYHAIALNDERSIRQVLRQLQSIPETDIRIFTGLLQAEDLTGVLTKAQWVDRWLEITKNWALEFPEAQAIARDALQSLHAGEISPSQWNIEKEELRQRCGLSGFDWNKYIADLEAEIHAAVDRAAGTAIEDRLTLEIKALIQEHVPAKRVLKINDTCSRFRISKAQVYELMREIGRETSTPECECLSFDELLDQESEGISYLIPGMLPKGETVLCAGMPKSGKTLLAIDAAFAIATGETYFLGEEVKQGKVLLVSVDESAQSTKAKLLKRGFRRGDQLEVMTKWDISQLNALETKLEDIRPELVVIDSLKRITLGREISENSAEFADMIYQLKELTGKYGAACILIHHSNKNGDAVGLERVRGNTAIAGAVWGTWMLDRIPKPDPKNPKRMKIDPADPTRILSCIPRDCPGQELKIELNLDNLSFGISTESEEDQQAQQEKKTQQQKILDLLSQYAPKGFTGREILEKLGLTHSAYTILSRMTEQRLITQRQSKTDRRMMVYCLPGHPLPPPTKKMFTNSSESTVVEPETNSKHLVNNSEKISKHFSELSEDVDNSISELARDTGDSQQKNLVGGGEGVSLKRDPEKDDVTSPAGNNAESVKAARRARAKSVGDDGWLVIESSAPTAPAPDIDSAGRENWTPGTKFRSTSKHPSYRKYLDKILTVKSNHPNRFAIEAEETRDGFNYWCIERVELDDSF